MSRKLKKLLCIFLALIIGLSSMVVGSFAVENDTNTSSKTRDIVLVLDDSGSMSGTPLTNLKKAAIKFCSSMLSADGTNRIAVVIYGSGVESTTNFTDDIDTLTKAINSMRGDSATNTTSGVKKADELLKVSHADIKNILIMTDGLPQSGETSSTGPYTSNDYSGYRYANALHNAIVPMLDEYNIYTFGFFHSMNGSDKDFAAKLLNDIQNSGYYEVTNPDDLEFTFGEIVDDITQAQLRNLYTKQHVAYYKNDFKSEVKKIEFPSDDGNVKQNTNYLLGNIVKDASEDSVSKNYNIASAVTNVVNLDFDFMDKKTANYELILADIVTSEYYTDVIQEASEVAFKDDALKLFAASADFIDENIDTLAEKNNTSVKKLREEWEKLTDILDEMKVTDDPGKYAEAFGKCSNVVDECIKDEQKVTFLESLKIKDGFSGDAIGATLDAITGTAFKTAEHIATYYSSYEAYCTASEIYKETLSKIRGQAFVKMYELQSSLSEFPFAPNHEAYEYYSCLATAITNFLDNASEEATSADQIAKEFAKNGLENFGKEFAKSTVLLLLTQIPVVKQINEARKIIGFTASIGMFLVDVATEIDDRAYSAALIYNLYYLIDCAQETADYLGGKLEKNESFESAYSFDESMRIWRCCSLMLCDLGIEFETYCLQGEKEGSKDASWYSTAITMAALEKLLISDIHCHSVNLSYDPSTGTINLGPNTKIVTIACPVTVRVTDENGKQIALLADNQQTIEKGYEPYFHVIETERGNDKDYMKICYIPDTWNVTFTGTGIGTMHVLKADIVDGKIQNEVKSPTIPVVKGTEGHVSNTDDSDIVVIDSLEPVKSTLKTIINFVVDVLKLVFNLIKDLFEIILHK